MYVFKIIIIDLSSLDTLLHYSNENICLCAEILIVIVITENITDIFTIYSENIKKEKATITGVLCGFLTAGGNGLISRYRSSRKCGPADHPK